jgi:hypothetical protein
MSGGNQSVDFILKFSGRDIPPDYPHGHYMPKKLLAG